MALSSRAVISSSYRDLPADEAFIRGICDQIESEVGSDELAQFLEYRDRPADFVREKLGVTLALNRNPNTFEIVETSYQEEFLQACSEHSRVAWRASHGVGKTSCIAWLIIWWLLTRPFSRVLVLAPAFERQIGKYLWPEVRKWVRRALVTLPLNVQTKTIGVEPYEEEWFALAIQASDPDKVEGGHAESLLVIGDEAKGLSQEVVNAMQGTQTDIGAERLYVLTSVPGVADGPFYECFGELSERWYTMKTDAASSANVREGWIEEMRDLYKEGTFDWVTRVLANFFPSIAGGLFTPELLEDVKAAKVRKVDPEADIQAGVDIHAGGREETVLTLRSGENVILQEGFPGKDPRGPVAARLEEYRDRLAYINCDAGGPGYYFIRHLEDLDFPVVEFNFGAAPEDPEKYARANAEQYVNLFERMDEGRLRGLDGVKYRRTFAQLASVRTKRNSKGQTVLIDKRESAKEAKKAKGKGWSSPDWADSLMMAFAPPQKVKKKAEAF